MRNKIIAIILLLFALSFLAIGLALGQQSWIDGMYTTMSGLP
ncbi:MAG: hypothetical protein ACFFEN_05870 [Candidatus Thorarchaeota archaeon]